MYVLLIKKVNYIYQTLVRLQVVYTCSILSTCVTVILLIVWVVIAQNKRLFNYYSMWFRALQLIDHSINISCLLLQNESALKIYNNVCCLCHLCIISTCGNPQINNRDITDSKATISVVSNAGSISLSRR